MPNPTSLPFPKHEACWLGAPEERNPAFFPVFARVSVAVQTALRERVPGAYFGDWDKYSDTKAAYPMLVYQASRPFQGKLRSELTYDVLNPKTLSTLFRTVKLALPDLLDLVETKLRDSGRNETAAKYARRRAPDILQSVDRLSKSRKCLYVLIHGEAMLINALIELAGLGSLTAKEQARRVASFEKKWNFQLRRLYPGSDFTWLAPAILDAASRAFEGSPNADAAPTLGAGPAAPQELEP